MKNWQILAISGSFRTKSTNTSILRAASILAPANIQVDFYTGLAQLPHFNPDLDCEPLPQEIIDLRQQIKVSHGVIISSSEYARGVPGSLKNALDWLVSSTEFPGKPVALINTNPRATIAQNSLKEILVTMSAQIIEPANLTLNLAGRGLGVQEIISDRKLSESLNQALSIFTARLA